MTFTSVLFLAYGLLDLILWEAISFKSGTNARLMIKITIAIGLSSSIGRRE